MCLTSTTGAKSSFATVAIFAFLWSYNDLFTQSFFLRYPQERAITGLLNEISSQAGVNYGLMAASVVLVVIPVLIVYVCLQKHIIKGLTAGAVKGKNRDRKPKRGSTMYRVVLIDDERLILEGLTKVVRWQDWDCEVVGSAGDARSGAELIRSLQPRILFTDIRMPGQDGLTMLAGLRSEFPDLQVTVLTGYRDFSYAQEAIRLGVTRFLLKPSKMEEIHEALTAMTVRLARGARNDASPDDGEAESESSRAGSFLVNQAMNYMKQHFTEKLTLQEVADACYVSQWHLSKLLNRYTEKSFYDILNGLRIEEAKKLLADPSLKVGEIGERVGYVDMAHFSRVFKKLTDMSANEYRNSL